MMLAALLRLQYEGGGGEQRVARQDLCSHAPLFLYCRKVPLMGRWEP